MGYRRPYKENVRLQFAVKFIVELIIVISLGYLVVKSTCSQYIVNGNSMNDQLLDGQVVLINKIAYLYDEPERYDIIYFRPSGIESGRTYIKRIIGLPGETVLIKDGYVYIDGTKLEDDIEADAMLSAGIAAAPVVLGEDEYFVLGDNRNNSEDSRFAAVGIVKKENIIGRPWVIVRPISQMSFIK